MCLAQRFLITVWPNAHAKLISDDATAHFAVEHEAYPAEHFPLGDCLAVREKPPNACGKFFVESHANLRSGRRHSLRGRHRFKCRELGINVVPRGSSLGIHNHLRFEHFQIIKTRCAQELAIRYAMLCRCQGKYKAAICGPGAPLHAPLIS